MNTFPKELLKPIKGTLSGEPFDASIEILLQSFELSLDDYTEDVETSIRLDCINLPTLALDELEGKTFSFPVNPDDGYIDGSIYFFSCHNPVDITQIEFLNLSDNEIEAILKAIFVLEFENTGFSNFEIELKVTVRK